MFQDNVETEVKDILYEYFLLMISDSILSGIILMRIAAGERASERSALDVDPHGGFRPAMQ